MEKIKKEIRKCIMSMIDMSKELDDAELMDMIHSEIRKKASVVYLSLREQIKLQNEVFNSIRGLDILQELVDDTTISEIMINGSRHIFIERNGRVEEWDKSFDSDEKLADIIQQIVSYSNRTINESNPIVDARLKDGSRVNIVLPPVAIDGPAVTIRKFPEETMTMERLIECKSISREAAEFMRRLVISGYNIFISGGTSSGKTTFLNALSNYIPSNERIITIEDSAELQIKGTSNLIRLEVKNANVLGENEITIRDLIKSSLRMRPDRIIVGEVRDKAAIDMLAGMNTGHTSMSTGHSNSCTDMLSRLETMVLLGADIPLLAIRKQIASALDIIVQLGRLRDGSRRVLEITEVLDCNEGEIELNPLYTFLEEGSDKEGKIIGELCKKGNGLINIHKLVRAGFINNVKSEKGV